MSTVKKKGLGRGLEALLGGPAEIVDAVKQEGAPSVLRLDQLQPGKYQPRTRMDEGALQELAASIRSQGLMQPILVASRGRAGSLRDHCRGAALPRLKIAGLDEVPVLVKDVADEAAAAMALIENIQREDLNPLEEAQGIMRLVREFNFTHEQAAESVGRSRSAVSNLLRLLNLAQPVQTMLMAGDLDMGHARALLSVDGANQITLANQIINKRLSVRETEKLVASTLKPLDLRLQKPNNGAPARDVTRLEEELFDVLGLPVQIKLGTRGKGQLTVHFTSNDALDGVLTRLREPGESQSLA
ncbi:ParB/RepB/Spo0J family partition protein [Cupriavidus basilensis]